MTLEDDPLNPNENAEESTEVVEEELVKDVPEVPPGEVYENFADAPLPSELREAIADLGWKAPTPVQGQCLPFTLRGRDLAGFAQTGTGKTGVFLITIAQRVLKARAEGQAASGKRGPLAVVLAPTRELALQIENDGEALFKKLNISSLAVFGGVDWDKQAAVLQAGVDVVVATPGRLKDYTSKNVVNFKSCLVFVCDEADRMFDMGFIDDVRYFFEKLPEDAQKLLFSATTNDEVKELAFQYLDKPEYIFITRDEVTPENITQEAFAVESRDKLKVLIGLLREHKPDCSIIFVNTKAAAEWLHFKLNGNGLSTEIITGDLPQRKRMALIKKIKAGEVKALIGTDVASRGLHIAGVTHVYNFDLPDDPSNYIHRIGRTARAGASGAAISLVCEDYGHSLESINTLLGEGKGLRAKWFDQKFSSIVDEAGTPPPRQRRDTGERSSGGRYDRANAKSGGGRSKSGPPDRGRSQQRPGGQHQGRDRGKNRGGSQQQRHEQRSGQQNRQRGQHHHHDQQHSKSKHAAHGYQHQQQRPELKQSAPESGSVFGMVRKIFSTLFGGKDDHKKS